MTDEIKTDTTGPAAASSAPKGVPLSAPPYQPTVPVERVQPTAPPSPAVPAGSPPSIAVAPTAPVPAAPAAPATPVVPTVPSAEVGTPAPAAAPLPATDPRLKENIEKILADVGLPERRGADAATEHPSLMETPLTSGPYRATMQMQEPQPQAPTSIPNPPPQPNAMGDLGARPQPTDRSPVTSLHTMKGDLQDIVREDKISLVRAVSLEADRSVRTVPEAALRTKLPGRWHTIILISVATLVLALLGSAALFGVYYLKTTKPASTAAPIGFIFAEQRIALPIDTQSPSGVREALASIGNGQGAAGSIIEIVPSLGGNDAQVAARRATLAEFFSALGAHPPEELVRALSNDFFVGIHVADVPSPVFIIPVTSYDHAFAGMLAWEQKMDADLAALYTQVPPYAPAQSGELPPPRTFQDLVMSNRDARILKDDAGTIVLYYSFPTQDLLIISASPYTFSEVLGRLQAARKL